MKLIKLTQNQFALVDDEDFEELNKFKWCARFSKGTKSFYAMRSVWQPLTKNVKTVLMHRQILNITEFSIKVDHINHDTLDNTRSNIIAGTNRQNMSNLKGKGTSKYTSVYTGVYWHKHRSKWSAGAIRNNKFKQIGYFNTEIEASNAYNSYINTDNK